MSVSWPLVLAGAFMAEVIGTMAGFGAATILTPIAALAMDIKTAIALVACFHLFGNASRLWFFGRQMRWQVWALFGLTGVTCSIVGALLTARLPSPVVEALFGAFLLAYVALSLIRPVRLPDRPSLLLFGGAASGFIAGVLGTGGAIRSACLLAWELPKEAYLGTSAAIALIVDATRLPVYMAGGLLPMTVWPQVLSLMVVAFTGAATGQRLVRRVPDQAFRRLVLALLVLMGVRMVWHGLLGIAQGG